MNHRYEDRSYNRGDRDRDRGRYSGRGGSEESGEHRSHFGFDDSRDRSHYGQNQYSQPYEDRNTGSGGSRFGASGYGGYGGEGQFGDQDRGYRDYSRGGNFEPRYGEGQRHGSGQSGGSEGNYGDSYGSSGSSNWRQQREGGSYGGYGSTGDYGYGSQGRGKWSSQQDRSSFGNFSSSNDESAQYYGAGNYSAGGSGYGGGYYGGGRQQSGVGVYGPSGLPSSQFGGHQQYSGGGGEYSGYGNRTSWGDRGDQERPGLLKRIFGRGPKGYKRSDERLREDISERLMQSDTIDSSEVTVEVVEGRVTLQGTVPDRYMKHAIEDVADSCPGIQDVDNRIRVEREGGGLSSSSSGSTTLGSDSSLGNGSKVRKQ
jgi:osmotically-inducible protein OsmY